MPLCGDNVARTAGIVDWHNCLDRQSLSSFLVIVYPMNSSDIASYSST